jgi:hypothetical protein
MHRNGPKFARVVARVNFGDSPEAEPGAWSLRLELTSMIQLRPYRTFWHGYAVTSNASQSNTVDEVLMVASSRSLGAVYREQFSVTISRGRQRGRIFTDDKLLLRDRIVRSSSRKAALELPGLEKALIHHGFTPKLTAGNETLPLSPSLSITRQVLQTLRPIRPLRAIRHSRLTRFAQAVASWATHLKLTGLVAPSVSQTTAQAVPSNLQPTLRPQSPARNQSNRISI